MMIANSVMFAEYDIAMEMAHALTSDPEALHPCERKVMRRAAPARLREYAAGRTAAHLALGRIGVSRLCVERAPDGRPVWPEHVVGSISHSGDLAVAAATRDNRVRGLGLDIEARVPPGQLHLAPRLLTARELAAINGLGPEDAGRALALYICCKEAAYKAAYSLFQEDFGFTDIEVCYPDRGDEYCVRPVTRLASQDALLSGTGRIGTFGKYRLAMFLIETPAG